VDPALLFHGLAWLPDTRYRCKNFCNSLIILYGAARMQN